VLHLIHKVLGAPIRATDGDIGTVDDFIIDLGGWAVRYLVVDTGNWFSGKKVLLSPMAVTGEWGVPGVAVNLSRERVWNSPAFDGPGTLPPEDETRVVDHYGHPRYWDATDVWGAHETPSALLNASAAPPAPAAPATATARRLTSASRVTGFHVAASDGEIGHVDDFLVGNDSWRVRYLLLDTSNWLGGRAVLLSPPFVSDVDETARLFHVSTTRQAIMGAPRFASIEASLDAAETGPPFTII